MYRPQESPCMQSGESGTKDCKLLFVNETISGLDTAKGHNARDVNVTFVGAHYSGTRLQSGHDHILVDFL